uniref:Putative transcription factor GTE6 n=1 Tax=Davidia involucrata TaxID=16924 RepID=A0A5B7BR18_DAVIN
METMDAAIPEVRLVGPVKAEGNAAEVEDFGHHVDEMFAKVDKLEQSLNEVEQFYLTTSKKHLNTSKGSSIAKDKDKDKHIASFKKRLNNASKREAAAVKRMQELMRQFGTILRQAITNALQVFYVILVNELYLSKKRSLSNAAPANTWYWED